MSMDSIRVVCRLRPLNKIEIANDGVECVNHTEKDITISVGGQENKYSFAFDRVFPIVTQQIQVYREVAIPVVKAVISGFNGTIFAYGQTGGGKTWTMEGPSHTDHQFKGLIPRTIEGLFEGIASSASQLEFIIKCSYVQIYNEKLFDLLDPSKARLEIKEDKVKGVFIQNCSEVCVSSPTEMLMTMGKGSSNRKVAFTGMNQQSSRSHSIFIIYLNQKNTKKNSTKQSKLYFVDLAGSQKVGKTNVQGKQLQQAKNINKSLSALGNVINALTSAKIEHIPYRDSKLTRILQESLGGNSKTTLIINCSMCSYNDKETLSTLRFGYRAKSIKNKAKINQEKSAKELMMLLDVANKTIADLKAKFKGNGNSLLGDEKQMDLEKENQISKEQQLEYEETIASLKQELDNQKGDQQERGREMQLRLKQLLLEISKEKAEKADHLSECRATFRLLSFHLNNVYKYVKRSYFDLQYMMNNVLAKSINHNQKKANNSLLSGSREESMSFEEQDKMENSQTSRDLYERNHYDETKRTLESTFKNIEEFSEYFEKTIKPILTELQEIDNGNQELRSSQEKQLISSPKTYHGRRMKLALSEPVLFPESSATNQNKDRSFMMSALNEQLQMSCIIQERNNDSQSDPISQEGSLSEIQTFLESLETKESQKAVVEEMGLAIKALKKENQQLKRSLDRLTEEKIDIARKVEQAFQERIIDLQQRVDQYKNILGRKDQQITGEIEDKEKIKSLLKEERIISERCKKIIQDGKSLKKYSEMEQRVRTLATERQKLYNQMFKMRGQLDQAEMNAKEKQEHVDSLKSVMLELEEQIMEKNMLIGQHNKGGGFSQESQLDIERRYHAQVYGSQFGNVIKTVKGGGQKQSSLRRKMLLQPEKGHQMSDKSLSNKTADEKPGKFVPFIKSFFG